MYMSICMSMAIGRSNVSTAQNESSGILSNGHRESQFHALLMVGQGISCRGAFAASAHGALSFNSVKFAWRSLIQHNINNDEAPKLSRRACSARNRNHKKAFVEKN